jgi:uncharacterized protein (DUF1684 family)
MMKKSEGNRTQIKRMKRIYTDLSAQISSICVICVLLTVVFIAGCGKNYTPEETAYIAKIEKFREAKNSGMKNDPASPFNRKGKVEFHDLKYFDADPSFLFRSRLNEYDPKDTVIIYGTKGEPRKVVRFGFVTFDYRKEKFMINVYQGKTPSGEIYYSIWFTDKTTNNESYGVGRYIDFEKNDDPDHLYEIDFNMAYNPYCAYSPDFSCAIPSKEDYIPAEIRAGEKKFHD